jgi:hypothetical protein
MAQDVLKIPGGIKSAFAPDATAAVSAVQLSEASSPIAPYHVIGIAPGLFHVPSFVETFDAAAKASENDAKSATIAAARRKKVIRLLLERN